MSARVCHLFRAQRLLGIAAVGLLLVGCEHYAPNVRPEAGSTEAIALEQAGRLYSQGASRAAAPSQLRIVTSGLTSSAEDRQACADWLDACWEAQGMTPAQEVLPGTTRPAPAQTFRGLLPCTGQSMGCTVQHATLTMLADRSWFVRIVYLDQRNQPIGAEVDMRGCWQRAPGNLRQFMLTQENEAPFASFLATSNNTLAWDNSAGDSRLHYTLTRQPELDSEALQATHGLRCSA